MSRLTDMSFEDVMNNLDAFDLIEWQGEIYNKLVEYERLGSVDYFKYCKNIEKSDLSHELEVYKRALEIANHNDLSWCDYCIIKARKELEDERN